MALADDEDTIEALGLERQHEALGVCVEVRASRWRAGGCDAAGLEKFEESSGVEWVHFTKEFRDVRQRVGGLVNRYYRQAA